MLALPLGIIRKNFNAFEKYNSRFEKILDESQRSSLEDERTTLTLQKTKTVETI